ncbi:hypothetical protein HMPREF9469_04875 [ [[Clostridium] citroniae WAL-17108]|uniref:SEFIR domain-containing protein n=4 Tax=Enterocloster citroniae TaxID=358743 RepID=G5HQL3_9FIRM|nr:hypothetical protein HMPREF9469_04875 [ [[Clostridium] citroniae WAL-17108]
MEKTPKVFISYSWTNEEHINRVVLLAERLVSHGVDVILDRWDLREGQDKYAFMEQCVTDANVDRVLLICDKMYAEKADGRKGGVGDETAIISSEVYGKTNQEKFLPVIFQKNSDGLPYMPAYIKRLLYFDLSDDNTFESEYEKLLRRIYDKPLLSKPELGKMPSWLNETVRDNLYPLKDIIKQLYATEGRTKLCHLVSDYVDKYLELVLKYKLDECVDPQMILLKIEEMKPLRDMYVDFIICIIIKEIDISEVITELWERYYNEVIMYDHYSDTEYFYFHLWEIILCTISILYHYKKYKIIYELVANTYFLNINCVSKQTNTQPITCFNYYFEQLEEYNRLNNDPKWISFPGELISKREYRPLITKESISYADILLHQLTSDLNNDIYGYHNIWHSYCYMYNKTAFSEFQKFKSKRHCNKLKELYGVNSYKEMIDIIKSSQTIQQQERYSSRSCPIITNIVPIEQIASLN